MEDAGELTQGMQEWGGGRILEPTLEWEGSGLGWE